MKKILLLVVMAIFATVMVACGSADKDASNDDKAADKDKAPTEEKKAEVPAEITVKHELGETTVKTNPEKVVVFDFGTLDTLDKLGVEVAALPQANIPPYLKKFEDAKYENVGSLKEPDFEKLSAINPDLIIISGRQADLYDQFSEIAPTIYLGLDPSRYMDSFKENLAIIGDIFDKKEEIDKELATIETSIKEIKEKAEASKKTGLIILANDDKISAYGPNSRFGLIHDVLGVKAVDDKIEVATHGQNVSFEYVVEQDPDILYVVDRGAVVSNEGGESASAKQVVENKLVENTKAFKEGNIVYLDPSYWYLSGGGLVSVTEMINEVSASLK